MSFPGSAVIGRYDVNCFVFNTRFSNGFNNSAYALIDIFEFFIVGGAHKTIIMQLVVRCAKVDKG